MRLGKVGNRNHLIIQSAAFLPQPLPDAEVASSAGDAVGIGKAEPSWTVPGSPRSPANSFLSPSIGFAPWEQIDFLSGMLRCGELFIPPL